MPETRSEEKRWSSEVRKRLPVWVSETVSPLIVDAISVQSLSATLRVDADKLFIDYEAVAGGSGYVAPSVMLEFGARSTGEPASVRDISCDAAGLVDVIEFPTARPRVMHAERTFWERATAIHVFCLQERLRGERFSRHWHDIVRLDDIGIADHLNDAPTESVESRNLALQIHRLDAKLMRSFSSSAAVVLL